MSSDFILSSCSSESCFSAPPTGRKWTISLRLTPCGMCATGSLHCLELSRRVCPLGRHTTHLYLESHHGSCAIRSRVADTSPVPAGRRAIWLASGRAPPVRRRLAAGAGSSRSRAHWKHHWPLTSARLRCVSSNSSGEAYISGIAQNWVGWIRQSSILRPALRRRWSVGSRQGTFRARVNPRPPRPIPPGQ